MMEPVLEEVDYDLTRERNRIMRDGNGVHIAFRVYVKFENLLKKRSIAIGKINKRYYIVPLKHTRPYIVWHLAEMTRLETHLDYKNQMYYKEP